MRRLTAVMAAAFALAGCGGEQAKPDDGPAQVAPLAGTLVYAEAIVKPEGDRAKEIQAALRKVARRDDVLDLLVRELDKSMREEGSGSFSADVEPWLGERLGVFFTSFEGDEPKGAIIAEVADEEKAKAALPKLKGKDDEAKFIEGFVVAGTPDAVAAAEKAAKGESLADSDDFTAALDTLDGDRIGHVWADVRRVVDALGPFVTRSEALKPYREAIAAAENPGIVAGFDVRGNRLALEYAVDAELAAKAGGVTGGLAGAPDLLGQLPAEAWLAVAAKDIGRAFRMGVDQGAAGTPGGAQGLYGEIKKQTGVDLEGDVLDRIRDVAFYASGTGMTNLGVGALIGTDGEDGASRLMGALQKFAEVAPGTNVEPQGDDGFLLRVDGAPFSFQAKRKGDQVAAGIGTDGADRLLAPKEPLKDSDAFKTAQEALGDDFKLVGVVRFPPMVQLIGGFVADDPDFAKAKPYLDAYDQLVLGDRKDGSMVVNRIAVTLK